MIKQILALLVFTLGFIEFGYAFDKISVAESINQIIFEGAQKVQYVKDPIITDINSGGVFVSDVERLNRLNLMCITEEASYKRFSFFNKVSDKKKIKKLLKFLKSNVDSKHYSKGDFKKIPAPESASIEALNCGSDRSDYVLGLNYKSAEGDFFRVEFSLDGFN